METDETVSGKRASWPPLWQPQPHSSRWCIPVSCRRCIQENRTRGSPCTLPFTASRMTALIIAAGLRRPPRPHMGDPGTVKLCQFVVGFGCTDEAHGNSRYKGQECTGLFHHVGHLEECSGSVPDGNNRTVKQGKAFLMAALARVVCLRFASSATSASFRKQRTGLPVRSAWLTGGFPTVPFPRR